MLQFHTSICLLQNQCAFFVLRFYLFIYKIKHSFHTRKCILDLCEHTRYLIGREGGGTVFTVRLPRCGEGGEER